MGLWALVAWTASCAPGEDGPPAADGSSGTRGTTGNETSTSSSGLGSTTGFGMEGPADDESGVGFVAPLDVACGDASASTSPHCALCSVRDQNCIDDFKCVPWAEDGGDAWTGTRCIEPPRSPVEVGDPCTIEGGPASGQDDCPKGSMCWQADPRTGVGECVSFCAPADREPACPANTGCMIDGVGVLALCLPPCDPLAPQCEADQSCRYFPASQAAYCIPNEGGEVLVPTLQCGDDTQCEEAEVCISAGTFGGCGTPSCCTPWCDLNDPEADAQCAAKRPNQVCRPLFDREPIPPEYAHLGLCALPPDDSE